MMLESLICMYCLVESLLQMHLRFCLQKWLRTLCDSVKDSYDYIIFDTPPVGVVGDAAIVSSVCDGTLLVIENGVTKKKTLCQIAAELEKIDTNILGVVQNMVGSKKDSSYYGKGNYGYYYGNNQNKK